MAIGRQQTVHPSHVLTPYLNSQRHRAIGKKKFLRVFCRWNEICTYAFFTFHFKVHFIFFLIYLMLLTLVKAYFFTTNRVS